MLSAPVGSLPCRSKTTTVRSETPSQRNWNEVGCRYNVFMKVVSRYTRKEKNVVPHGNKGRGNVSIRVEVKGTLQS